MQLNKEHDIGTVLRYRMVALVGHAWIFDELLKPVIKYEPNKKDH